MAVIFTCIFFDLDPAKSFPLRQAARAVAQQLGKVVEANVKSVSATGFLHNFIDGLRRNHNALEDYGIHMIRRLLESGLGVSEITWSQILPTAVAMVPNQSQVVCACRSTYAGLLANKMFSSPKSSITTFPTRERFTFPKSTDSRRRTLLKLMRSFFITAWKASV